MSLLQTENITDRAGVHVTERGPYIQTWSGRKFFPLDIRPEDIHIYDIAHALSMQCRFGGHCDWPYSVAQHSVYVSRLCPADLQLPALLHDASEAYLVDLPRPIKHLDNFDSYRRIEKELSEAIYLKYDCPAKEDPWIKLVDNAILATEAEQLMNRPEWTKDMIKANIFIEKWSQVQAFDTFIEEFNKLKHGT